MLKFGKKGWVLLVALLALSACGKKVEPQQNPLKWTEDQVNFEVKRCFDAINNATETDRGWCRCWLTIAATKYEYGYYGDNGKEVEDQLEKEGHFALCDDQYPQQGNQP